MEKEASHLERQHVHNVYEKIAPYFNDKCYKAWPKVQEFLLAQEPGSLVADIGCGNGKYLHINSQTFKIGSDYCIPLAEAARNRNYEVMVCDGLQLPYRDGAFDAVLSIAVIHHFSTKERRIRAIKEMARILRVGGQMMIYVWAMEQKRRKFEKQDLLIPGNKEPQKVSEKRKDLTEPESKNLPLKPLSRVHSNMPTKNRTKHSSFVDGASSPFKIGLHSSRRLTRSLESGLDISSKCASSDQKHGNILRRLYDYCTELRKSANMYPPRLSKPAHFLRQIGDLLPKYIQDLENDANKVTGLFTFPLTYKSYCTSSNVELGREMIKDLGNVPLPGLKANCNGPVNSMLSLNSDTNCKKDQQVPPIDNTNYLRYYHIFKQNELSDLIQQYIPELLVVSTFYDHSNWCVIAEKN